MDLGKIGISGVVLILANLIAIILALFYHYDFATMIWSYWTESVIIGVFVVFSILITGIRSKELIPLFLSIFFAGFFSFHYGFFHYGYYFFLTALPIFAPQNWNDVFLTAGIFLVSHFFSFLYYTFFVERTTTIQDITKQFIAPYSRIWAIHLTIILSGFVMAFFPGLPYWQATILLVIFMLLKTGGDLMAHSKKHETD